MALPTTLVELLSTATDRRAKESALIERDGERLVSITFAELSAAVAALADELRSRGVVRGDVVGVWLPNWIETIVWEFALASLGAASLGINTRYGVDEITHLLERGDPVGVVAPGRFLQLDFADRLRRASENGTRARQPWVAVARPEAADELTGFDVGAGAWAVPPLGELIDSRKSLSHVGRPEDPVNYFTTSGSTGLPKLAGHDQASVAMHSVNVAAGLDMRSGDRFLGALPLSGVFGFNPVMAMLSVGGLSLLEPLFEPSRVLEDIDVHEITHLVGGDDMIGRLMDAWHCLPTRERPALRRLRRGAIADFAGRVGAVVEWAEDAFTASISGVYGSSELFSLIAIWPSSLDIADRQRAGGRLLSSQISVRAIDPESGAICPPRATGELEFQGYTVVRDYLGDPAARRNAFSDDGWFRSGDLGFLLEQPDSFIYTCRAGDALRLRGFLVEPAEIERFLCTHPAVAAARVVGVASPGGGDVAVAYVQLLADEATTTNELAAFCRDQLAPFKVPSHVNVIDEFPTTTGTNGTKIVTAELRRRAQRQVALTGARSAPSRQPTK
jgi:fatty-acyl-CoA synthase